MRTLKVVFGGPNAVSIDWAASVDGMEGVAQRACVAVMTHEGSDLLLPARGTDVAATLLSYGVTDLTGLQHTLNFGALKARSDMISGDDSSRPNADRVNTLQLSLLDFSNNVASVGVFVSNQQGETTNPKLLLTQ